MINLVVRFSIQVYSNLMQCNWWLFDHLLIACQHYSTCTKLVSYCNCTKLIFYHNLSPERICCAINFHASHDVGDNYLTFQSLDTLNLQSTDVHYNYPV